MGENTVGKFPGKFANKEKCDKLFDFPRDHLMPHCKSRRSAHYITFQTTLYTMTFYPLEMITLHLKD